MGFYIQGWRKARRKISLSELARLVGTTKSHISEIENDIEFPSARLMRKISAKLKAPHLFRQYLELRYPEVKKLFLEEGLDKTVRKYSEDPMLRTFLVELGMTLASDTSETQAIERILDFAPFEGLPSNNEDNKRNLISALKVLKNYYTTALKEAYSGKRKPYEDTEADLDE